MSDEPRKFADRVAADAPGRAPDADRLAAVMTEKFGPMAEGLQQTVTRLIDEHSRAVNGQFSEAMGSVADIVVKHVARELAERRPAFTPPARTARTVGPWRRRRGWKSTRRRG